MWPLANLCSNPILGTVQFVAARTWHPYGCQNMNTQAGDGGQARWNSGWSIIGRTWWTHSDSFKLKLSFLSLNSCEISSRLPMLCFGRDRHSISWIRHVHVILPIEVTGRHIERTHFHIKFVFCQRSHGLYQPWNVPVLVKRNASIQFSFIKNFELLSLPGRSKSNSKT